MWSTAAVVGDAASVIGGRGRCGSSNGPVATESRGFQAEPAPPLPRPRDPDAFLGAVVVQGRCGPRAPDGARQAALDAYAQVGPSDVLHVVCVAAALATIQKVLLPGSRRPGVTRGCPVHRPVVFEERVARTRVPRSTRANLSNGLMTDFCSPSMMQLLTSDHSRRLTRCSRSVRRCVADQGTLSPLGARRPGVTTGCMDAEHVMDLEPAKLEPSPRSRHVEPPNANNALADPADRLCPIALGVVTPLAAGSWRSARAGPRRGEPRTRGRGWISRPRRALIDQPARRRPVQVAYVGPRRPPLGIAERRGAAQSGHTPLKN